MKSKYYVGKEIIRQEIGMLYFDSLLQPFVDGRLRKEMEVLCMEPNVLRGDSYSIGKAFLLSVNKLIPRMKRSAEVLVILKRALAK